MCEADAIYPFYTPGAASREGDQTRPSPELVPLGQLLSSPRLPANILPSSCETFPSSAKDTHDMECWQGAAWREAVSIKSPASSK